MQNIVAPQVLSGGECTMKHRKTIVVQREVLYFQQEMAHGVAPQDRLAYAKQKMSGDVVMELVVRLKQIIWIVGDIAVQMRCLNTNLRMVL